jgi:hypothetical protein
MSNPLWIIANPSEHLHQGFPKSEVQSIELWTEDGRPTSVPKIQTIGTWTWTTGFRVQKSLYLENVCPVSIQSLNGQRVKVIVNESLMRENCVMAKDSAGSSTSSPLADTDVKHRLQWRQVQPGQLYSIDRVRLRR